ncbi:MAG: glycosyltransferase [Phycisphaerales bacterium]|nr:MAG: glycosyltransferase [Phycisphaerales bacterium]
MPKLQQDIHNETLLVFNCHEAWVYQLCALGCSLDIIVGLRGQYSRSWDLHMRPLPPNSRLISLPEALDSPKRYYCIIAHNMTDLLEVKSRPEPRLVVLHSTLEGRVIEEGSSVTPQEMREVLSKYLELVGGHAVAGTILKAQSWRFSDDIVVVGVDPSDYRPYSGQLACGLRICNFIESRKKILLWDFHARAFAGIPVRLVGHNPNMPGVTASESWDHLKALMQAHRFHIHTADLQLEDGFNMATIEAMAAGMPVLGNCHPSSPIQHGVSGFLSNDPDELRKYARILLEDRELAAKMGREARKTAMERFPMGRFRESFLMSIETARRKHESCKVNPSDIRVSPESPRPDAHQVLKP